MSEPLLYCLVISLGSLCFLSVLLKCASVFILFDITDCTVSVVWVVSLCSVVFQVVGDCFVPVAVSLHCRDCVVFIHYRLRYCCCLYVGLRMGHIPRQYGL